MRRSTLYILFVRTYRTEVSLILGKRPNWSINVISTGFELTTKARDQSPALHLPIKSSIITGMKWFTLTYNQNCLRCHIPGIGYLKRLLRRGSKIVRNENQDRRGSRWGAYGSPSCGFFCFCGDIRWVCSVKTCEQSAGIQMPHSSQNTQNENITSELYENFRVHPYAYWVAPPMCKRSDNV